MKKSVKKKGSKNSNFNRNLLVGAVIIILIFLVAFNFAGKDSDEEGLAQSPPLGSGGAGDEPGGERGKTIRPGDEKIPSISITKITFSQGDPFVLPYGSEPANLNLDIELKDGEPNKDYRVSAGSEFGTMPKTLSVGVASGDCKFRLFESDVEEKVTLDDFGKATLSLKIELNAVDAEGNFLEPIITVPEGRYKHYLGARVYSIPVNVFNYKTDSKKYIFRIYGNEPLKECDRFGL